MGPRCAADQDQFHEDPGKFFKNDKFNYQLPAYIPQTLYFSDTVRVQLLFENFVSTEPVKFVSSLIFYLFYPDYS